MKIVQSAYNLAPMREPAIKMNQLHFDDIHTVYTRWRGLTNAPANRNTQFRFLRFVGVAAKEGIYSAWYAGEFEDPDVRKKIDWLLSPQYKVFYKMWLAQNEKV